VGETFGIPSISLTIPSVLHPEGLRFPGVLLGWFAHWMKHISADLGKQEIRISRNTMIWIIKRILSGSLVSASRSRSPW
jgi:hypothetical protein